jgi:hypothetical protein
VTIVCYRAGVLAADTALWGGDVLVGSTSKIARAADGSVVGVCGRAGIGERYLAWVRSPYADLGSRFKIEENDISFEAIIARPCGDVFFVDEFGNPFRTVAPFYAIGIGEKVAYGALAMGASAVQAVDVAIRYSAHCGGEVDVLQLEPPA